MSTNRDIQILSQWFSPSYPLGAFAYSHGLETAIHTGEVSSAFELQIWLAALIEHGSLRNDVLLLTLAYDAETVDDLTEIDAAARAFAATAERLMETQQQGAAFAQTTSAIWDTETPNLTNPVAVGAAARRLNLPIEMTALIYAQSFVSNLVSAAVRLVPLGQTDGQKTLAALAPRCIQVVEDMGKATLDDLASSTFAFDIASLRHETLQPRIFRS